MRAVIRAVSFSTEMGILRIPRLFGVGVCASRPGINAASLLQSYFIGHGQARLAVCLFDMDILRSLQKGSYTQPIFPDLTKVVWSLHSPRYSWGTLMNKATVALGRVLGDFCVTSLSQCAGSAMTGCQEPKQTLSHKSAARNSRRCHRLHTGRGPSPSPEASAGPYSSRPLGNTSKKPKTPMNCSSPRLNAP